MNGRIRFAAFLVGTFGLMGHATAAVITTYGDRASWEAATVSFEVENFDSTPNTEIPGGEEVSVEFGDFTITIGPRHHSVGFFYGAFSTDLHEPQFALNQYYKFTFDRPITAFALDLGRVGDDYCEFSECPWTPGGIAASISASTFNIPAGAPFFGVTTQFAFREILFSKPCCEQDAHNLDNVSYRFVPEPSSLAVLGLGLVGVAFTRRRKL